MNSETGALSGVTHALTRLYCGFLLIGGVLWAIDVPLRLGFSLIEAEWLGPYLGVAIAAAFLQSPYKARAGVAEIVLGLAAICSWLWLSLNYGEWLVDIVGYTAEKYLPAIISIGLMLEAIRKSCGLPISLLAWLLIIYGFVGFVLPPPLQADRIAPEGLLMYLYSDTNAILGLVLGIIASLVLAFIVFGKLMEVSGATRFFTDVAMSLMGHRRGGPAKIAVVASSMMGTISGSPVANIMSTGVVTIPLMKKSGFKAHYAAAVEAVASTGGQIAPPVMGATAFLMAEFLQISYAEVAIAAILPAVFFYACLFVQVDSIAERDGLVGIPKAHLPALKPVLAAGWIFVVPLVLLIYLLFFQGYSAATAAMTVSALLLILSLLRGGMRSRATWSELIFGGGSSMIPLVLIGGAAGVVVGIMNVTGLGLSLSFVLVQVGTESGMFVMLVLTALLSILLGMGMPSTAIYVVLASVIAPALVRMDVPALAAHMFIFYFGVLSFLTPPVAVSSYVAAGLAGSDMWRTGWAGMRLSAVAFMLPFVWVYEPALLLQGSAMAIAVMCCSIMSAILVFSTAMTLLSRTTPVNIACGALALILAFAIGCSSIWLGSESPLTIALAASGALIYFLVSRFMRGLKTNAEGGVAARGSVM